MPESVRLAEGSTHMEDKLILEAAAVSLWVAQLNLSLKVEA